MALLVHAAAAAAGSIGVSTTAVDTTGATLFVVGMQNISTDDTGLLIDSASNTWVLKPSLVCASSRFVQMAYCINPTTSATHTFSISGANSFYPVIVVGAWSNTPAASFDAVTAGNFVSTPTTTVQPGSLTPANANNLLVTFVGGDVIGSASADSSFVPVDQILKSGHQGGAMYYLIQSAATPQNPTWTVGSEDATIGAQMMAFKESGSGGGGSNWGPMLAQRLNRIVQD
jgi:hypothetical protein